MSSLAFDVSGRGPDLVCIHGLASARTAWAPIVDHLANDFTVWRIDLPGHGESPSLRPSDDASPSGLARSVQQFATEHGIARPHVVGNSLGGFIGLEWAALGDVASVTALCPAGLWQPRPSRSATIEFNHRAAKIFAPVAPALMSIPFLRGALMASASERPRAMSASIAVDAVRAQTQARGFEACYTATLTTSFDTRESLIAPDVPVTVAFGDRDRILPSPRMQQRDMAPAHTRWETLYRCGHVPMWDVPRVSVDLIRQTAQLA